jgi:PKD repeat protein
MPLSRRLAVAAVLASLPVACSNDASPASAPLPLSLTCSATPATGVAPLTVAFLATASGGATGNQFSWSFGDGTSSGALNTSHVYAQPGNFNATATVTAAGETTSCSKSIVAQAAPTNRPPVAVFTVTPNPPKGKAPFDVTFGACPSSDPDGDPLVFTFDVGDGPEQQAHCRKDHTYRSPGTYKAKVCVNDGYPGHPDQCQSYTVVVS